MLLAIVAMYNMAGTTDIETLLGFHFPVWLQFWLWLAFFASFAVKMPMWPVHTWLPDAHVEAPTAGSVILAGILLKMGVTASCASRCRCSPAPRKRWRRWCSRCR